MARTPALAPAEAPVQISVRKDPTRALTHEVYMEEHNTLADRTLTKVGVFIGEGDLPAAAALLLAYQRKRDALWDERRAIAARETRP